MLVPRLGMLSVISQEHFMALMSTSARRGILGGLLAAVFAVLLASPASAHAELVASTPANGARLDRAPAKVEMRFTEAVNLIPGGSGWWTTRGERAHLRTGGCRAHRHLADAC